MRTSEQIDKLAEALAKAQGQMTNPEKNKTATIPTKSGTKYSYNYADLPEIINATRKALSENGLSHSMGIRYQDHGIILAGRLMHTSGQWIESEYELPKNTDPKTMAASMTYGRRYLFSALIGIAADEDTDEAPESGDSTYKPREKPQQSIKPNQWKFGEEHLNELKKLCEPLSWDGKRLIQETTKLFGKNSLNALTHHEYLSLIESLSNMFEGEEFDPDFDK